MAEVEVEEAEPAEDNAADVVSPVHQDQVELQEGQENPANQVRVVCPEVLARVVVHHATLRHHHLASRVPMALLVLLDHQDLLEALEPMAVLDRLDTAHPMDHLDPKDHPDLMELLVLLEDPDNRDSPPFLLQLLLESPGHKDHLDLEVLPEAMDSLETAVAKVG